MHIVALLSVFMLAQAVWGLVMVSTVGLAKRAFVKVLLQLAVTYWVELSLSRDSPADAVNAAYRKVPLKVHPDKGRTGDHQTASNAVRDAWEASKAAAPGIFSLPVTFTTIICYQNPMKTSMWKTAFWRVLN